MHPYQALNDHSPERSFSFLFLLLQQKLFLFFFFPLIQTAISALQQVSFLILFNWVSSVSINRSSFFLFFLGVNLMGFCNSFNFDSMKTKHVEFSFNFYNLCFANIYVKCLHECFYTCLQIIIIIILVQNFSFFWCFDQLLNGGNILRIPHVSIFAVSALKILLKVCYQEHDLTAISRKWAYQKMTRRIYIIHIIDFISRFLIIRFDDRIYSCQLVESHTGAAHSLKFEQFNDEV